jgi:ubiquinone/menaquinone biosynthesis C-methylase UbiE
MKLMSTEKLPNQPAPKTKGRTIPWASFYDTTVWLLSLGQGRAMRQATVELAQIKPGDRVLDVGCGTGDLTMAAKALAGPSGEVVGTDASPEMIDLARRKAARAGVEVTFQLDLIENITFPDNQFDVVLSSLMMHHLPDDLKREGLAEIYRVLKPEGRLLIVDMESSSGGSIVQRLSDLMIQLHGGHTGMQNNVKKLIPLVEAAGFISLKTDKMNRQLSYIAGKKKAPAS